jgi:hypothetical protein
MELLKTLPRQLAADATRIGDSSARRVPLPARLAVAVALAIVAMLAVPAASLAAAAYVDTYHDNLTYMAGSGERNNVAVTVSGTTYTITDPGATITPGSGCTKVTSSSVTCVPVYGGPINYVAVLSGDQDDRVTIGDGINSWVDGGSGNDRLVAGSGSNWLFGNTGDDYLDGGLGSDLLNGGDGNDTVDYSSRTAPLTITLDGSWGDGQAGENDNVSTTVENVIGGAGNDTITGSPASNYLAGGPGDDSLAGGAGDDTLDGGPGHDALDGGDGADVLRAQDGSIDTLTCGAGVDTVSVDPIDILAADCEVPASGGASGVTLDQLPKSITMTKRGYVRLPIACPASSAGGCRGTLELTTARGSRAAISSRRSRSKVLGRGKFSIAAGKTKVIKVKMSRNGRRRVLLQHRLRCQASAVTRSARGSEATARKKITLKAPRHRRG